MFILKDLVQIKRGVISTTSNIIAEEFGIAHRNVVAKIEDFTARISAVRFNSMFTEISYINDRGREYKSFSISKSGYMFLVMNISTKRADEKKLLFIDAFEKMEQMLLNQSNVEWVTARNQTIAIRNDETDVIKKFIEYAIASGSNGAKFYYKHFTTATYKALSLLEHKKPKTRDTLDMLELNQIALAEHIVTTVIEEEMDSGEHYKVIFEKCKNALEKFAGSLYIKKTKVN